MKYTAIRIQELVAAELKRLSKEEHKTLSGTIEMLIDLYRGAPKATSQKDILGIQDIPEELDGLAPDELPECCQRIFEDHTDVCEHWEKAWVKEFGQRVLGYRNRLTGRSAADPAYHKYV